MILDAIVTFRTVGLQTPYKPDDASTARDVLASTRSESTPSRNETGAGETTIAQSLEIITRVKRTDCRAKPLKSNSNCIHQNPMKL
jgi:hypothetical protein